MEQTLFPASNNGGEHMIDLLFINICSLKGVHPDTTRAIIREESGFHEWAMNINRPKDLEEKPDRKSQYENFVRKIKTNPPANKAEAVILATQIVGAGFSVDIGMMQINSFNFKPYLLSVEDALDPCKNIRVGTEILKRFYDQAEHKMGPGQATLKAALSAYNTGNYSAGFQNGYVAKYYGGKLIKHNSYEADILVQNNSSEGDINGNDQSDISTGTSKRRGNPIEASIGEGTGQPSPDF
jgi:type IV secretion system protein VirB1